MTIDPAITASSGHFNLNKARLPKNPLDEPLKGRRLEFHEDVQ